MSRVMCRVTWRLACVATFACAPIAGIDDVRLEGPEMVAIGGGGFTMGCANGPGCESDEITHLVDVSAFEIDETEVTQEQYGRCVDAGACVAPSCDWDPVGLAIHPVVCVRWTDAVSYCERLGKRLPTEAEWEKAARGQDERAWPWGNVEPTCGYANVFGCATGAERVGSHPQGESPYHALDLAGNVAEWVADWYDAAYYEDSSPIDPTGPTGPTTGRGVRGGSFLSSPYEVRVSDRANRPESDVAPARGFRCAR
jgi:formylglycine-generating enzyme required for sulfatase activity